MKKHISRLLALAMFISVAIGLRAERVVDMPDFECRKSHVLTVERITLSDNETRVDFRVEAKKGYKGTVGDNSRLKDIITHSGRRLHPLFALLSSAPRFSQGDRLHRRLLGHIRTAARRQKGHPSGTHNRSRATHHLTRASSRHCTALHSRHRTHRGCGRQLRPTHIR